jgi:hypothetical protein
METTITKLGSDRYSRARRVLPHFQGGNTTVLGLRDHLRRCNENVAPCCANERASLH